MNELRYFLLISHLLDAGFKLDAVSGNKSRGLVNNVLHLRGRVDYRNLGVSHHCHF